MVAVFVVALLAYGGIVLTDLGRAGEDGAGRNFGHVHGLGMDPADDSLYAATHEGLFRLPEAGAPVLVSDRVQDFMGFTVVGPRHFLASGHPGEGTEGPSSLGLIESVDAGLSWAPVSLAGAADFHALEAHRGRVYGFNALTGEFLVSANQKTWQTRATTSMADFAVGPTEPSVIVAATEHGLAQSTDGGRSFTPMPGPRLLALDWAPDGALVGATPEGVLQSSSDGGGRWQARGNLGGPPQALHARSRTEIYAAVDGQVLVSRDGGRTVSGWGQQ